MALGEGKAGSPAVVDKPDAAASSASAAVVEAAEPAEPLAERLSRFLATGKAHWNATFQVR
jgi:hypothetical protein